MPTRSRSSRSASSWPIAWRDRCLKILNRAGSSWSIPYSTGNLGVNGDAYIGKSATIASSTQVINGDLESDGPITPALFSATGTTWSSAPAFAVLTAPMAAYAIAGNKVVISPFSDINGYAFPAESAGTYRMLYKVGDVIITGNFTGSGLIVATGDVTLYGPCSVSGGRIVVVAGDELLLRGTAPINAYVYARTVYHQDKLNNLIGAIVCQQMGSNKADCNVTYDPYLWNNPGERIKLRMPGHWP